MIGLDTNVIIRYLAQDDDKQSAAATQIIETQLNENKQGFISLIVLVEIIWVLKSCYMQTKTELYPIVENILGTKQFMVEQSGRAYKALRIWKNGNGDYSDALIAVISRDNKCTNTLTFDKKAASVGMVLISKNKQW